MNNNFPKNEIISEKFKVFITANSAWNLVNFRSSLILSMIHLGYEVTAIAPHDNSVADLKSLGCRYIPLPIDNIGSNPGRDLLLLTRYFRLIRSHKPNVFLGFTIKPNIFGSIAAHLCGVRVVNNITGLGAATINGGWLNYIVLNLYRLALPRSFRVFFQNADDHQIFISAKLISKESADLLPGSGVNLVKFTAVPLPGGPVVRFLVVARMLWDKGIGEFVDAARILRQRGVMIDACLLGFVNVKSPTAISRQQIDEWEAEGVIRYLGSSDDVRKEIAQADCIVLPSYYREGVPKGLIEAAAMGRPIITTNSTGCRDVVEDGINGYLCNVRDSADLADKMNRIVDMSVAEREAMGIRGRRKVEREFDENIVIGKYLHIIQLIRSHPSECAQ